MSNGKRIYRHRAYAEVDEFCQRQVERIRKNLGLDLASIPISTEQAQGELSRTKADLIRYGNFEHRTGIVQEK